MRKSISMIRLYQFAASFIINNIGNKEDRVQAKAILDKFLEYVSDHKYD